MLAGRCERMSGGGDAVPGGTYRDHRGSQRMDPAQRDLVHDCT